MGLTPRPLCWDIYVHTPISVYTHAYIYIEREREMCVYIYKEILKKMLWEFILNSVFLT